MVMTQRERTEALSILGTSMPLKEREREEEERRGASSGPAHSSWTAILMSLTRADGVEVVGTRTAHEEE